MNGHSVYFQLRAFLWTGILGLGLLMNAHGQESRIPPQNNSEQAGEKVQDFKIRVGVEEVRLDAVVVDKSGRQITDLTADDFEIFQDGQPQKIISSTYITENRAQPARVIVPSPDTTKAPPIPAPILTRDDVRRTIVILIDDYSMRQFFEDVYRVRASLKKFVETQMQPGDLVSILQTNSGTSALSAFSSDKKELLARVNSIRFKPPAGFRIRDDAFIPQPMAIAFCIRALQDMPGRKFLMLMSDEVTGGPDSAYNWLADLALRAGVVIHTLDMTGVIFDQVSQRLIEDPKTGFVVHEELSMDAESRPFEDSNGRAFDAGFGPTRAQLRIEQSAARKINRELPLSKKTGGLFLTGNNFFINGIGTAEEEMKGYYLLSYLPPANTIRLDAPIAYHKVRIIAKRPGSEVHTRDGFFGAPDSPGGQAKTQNPLMEAMFSPFRYDALKLDLAAGYIDDPSKGYLLRAWLHLDGQQVGIVKEKDGSNSISLEAIAATSDINGLSQESGNMRIGFPVNNKEIHWIRENGIKFAISIPAKKTGAYYVRAAVKDQASGAIGSAYQFVEIPDLKKDVLSLSSIFILAPNEDAAWIQSGITEESQSQPKPSPHDARRRTRALMSLPLPRSLRLGII
jgi:VWFA-related protein